MDQIRHTSLTIQLRLNEPEDLQAITSELELFKATIEPPYERFVLGPFPGFHQDAFTIFVQPHGCKARHKDIVTAHEDVIRRLRLLANSWESFDASVEIGFGGGEPECIQVAESSEVQPTFEGDLDRFKWFISTEVSPIMEGAEETPVNHINFDAYSDEVSLDHLEGYLKKSDVPFTKAVNLVDDSVTITLDFGLLHQPIDLRFKDGLLASDSEYVHTIAHMILEGLADSLLK